MSERQVAVYARVSSDQQAAAGTIESQLASLRERVATDGFSLPPEVEFVDPGFSGATLVRPALERLRDLAAAGGLDRLYVHSPDRLARKYAYQVLLVDELTRAGVEVIFLNRPLGRSAEDDLLLQVQGMVAEYERAKILERSRRGKRHAAHGGSVSVLSTAPYGYRYVGKHDGGGQARLEIAIDEARIVRQIFDWVGRERASIAEVRRRLDRAGERSPRGKSWWDRTTIWGILKNPAYQGKAAFGKTRVGPMRTRLRAQRGGAEQPRRSYSTYDVPPEEWISVAVPAIVGEDVYAAVQEQLAENRKRARQHARGARHLLQGLITCKKCGYAYYGKPVSITAAKGKKRDYAYYRCVGADAFRFGGQRVCMNRPVRTDLLERAVWQEVRALMEHPDRLEEEYRRRLSAPRTSGARDDPAALQNQLAKVRRGISRMIDGYAEGLIDKAEFEPRVKRARERLTNLESQAAEISDDAARHCELQRIIGKLTEFSAKLRDGLEQADWSARREVIRALVKRVAVDDDQVEVVFRVGPGPFVPSPERGILQDCGRRDQSAAGESLPQPAGSSDAVAGV